ncbi:FAD-dependent oxidoreductase [bacterium]|nr:FAD-dependent oxidoreductase [bacterium]
MNLPIRKSLKGRRAVVIGSTPAGLSAAISLAVRGARVVVLEAGPVPAPALRPVTVEDWNFLPPAPPLTSPAILAELVSSAGLRLTDFVTLERDEVAAQIRLGKEVVPIPHDPGLLAGELARIGELDTRKLESLFGRMGRLREGADGLLRARAMGIAPPLGALRMLPDLLDVRTEWRQAHARFPESAVRTLLMSFHPLAGLMPTTRSNAYWRWLGEFLLTGGWRVEGGHQELTRAMLRLCDLLSVRVICRAKVERVELKNGCVKQVVAGGGQKELAASLVVVADGLDAARYIPLVEELRGPRPAARQALLTLYLGLNNKQDLETPVTLLPSGEANEESRAIERWHVPAGIPSLAIMKCEAPEGEDLPEPEVSPEEDGEQATKTRIAVRAVVPAASSAWRWNEDQRDQEKRLIVERLDEAGVLKKAGDGLEVSELRLTPLMTGGVQGDYAWRGLLRHPRKKQTIGGLYDCRDAQLAGWSFASEILSGMAVAVRAARDAKGE